MFGEAFQSGNERFFREKPRRNANFVILLAGILAGCGLPGGTGYSNEAVPASATYLTGGSFTGSGGVTGTAQVYLNGSTVLLHLEGMSAPTGTLYGVFLENGSPSNPFYLSTMKTPTGNQNYFTGRAEDPSNHFSRVAIRATTSTTSTEMASAALSVY